MISEPFVVVLSVLLLVAFAIVRPERATCPPGSYVEGVRPSGATQCLSVEPDYDCSGANRCHGRAARWRVPMRIACTGGMRPIVVDGRTVGCQRGGYQ